MINMRRRAVWFLNAGNIAAPAWFRPARRLATIDGDALST
jgi:hypothetical protein